MRKFCVLIFTLVMSLPLLSQRVGENVYDFLQITNSARVSALGGFNVSLDDDDINLIFHNPALLSPEMDQHLTLNYLKYFAGSNFGYSSYAFEKEGVGTFGAGIHYIDWGIMKRYDEFAQFDGYFKSSEYAVNFYYSRSIIDSVFRVGATFRPIMSFYERYSSFALSSDIGAIYHLRKTNTTLGLVLKDFGVQLITFAGTRESMPFQIQAGITQALAHAPFRFHIQLQHLEQWNLRYESDVDDFQYYGVQDVEINPFDRFADNLMRHVVIGAELRLGESFHFDFGYNYRMRQEMKIDSNPGSVGFSWGFGMRIARYHIAFGHANYHLAGGTNHFSLSTDLSTFYRSK